ncbi:MAG: ATP-binding cassette domain-containing protein [Candidatus Omnitrophica bacterium]|nr:ATP-binding cassette domain-containing protein [Candidatus Omnitrophota bacterium]
MFAFSIFNALVSAALYVIFNGFFNQGQVIIKDLPYLGEQTLVFSARIVPFFVIAVFLLRGAFDFLSNYLMSNIGLRVVMKVRNDLYDHMIRLSQKFYSHGRTGDMISRIMSDVAYIQGSVTDVIVDLVKQPLIIIFNIPMAFIWGGKLAVVALVTFPIVAIPITVLGKRLRKITRNMQERTADITSILEETFTGIRVVKAFNMEQREISKFEAVNKSVFNFFKKMLKITLIQRPLVEVMGAVGAAIAIWFGMQYLSADRFVAFIGAMFIFYEPLKKLSKVNSNIQQSIGAGTRIFEIIDQEPDVQDAPSAVPFREAVREIEFSNVSFRYVEDRDVLKDINLRVEAGEVIALVGASGSGKTSLVNLLPRFYDPTSGSLRINGRDIREFKVKTLRDQIGLVSQEIVLFNDTIRGNIAYGKPGATFEEIVRAAEAAYADDFIRELDKGYDSWIGEKGFLLSGGQRQRIAIARAMLKNPPILILDEATSQLDTESEREVQRALENLMQGKTAFVIAHRLSTVQKADRILVLDEGRIVQQGTSESLLREDGPYRRLHDLQFNL